MGVNGLWTVVQPCARPTNLATLNRKRLAVDASIWIYQFLKAVRDKEGNALRNSHVVGFFRRICKLLWFGIQPVFVFDGGAPALKRATIQGRQRRREGRREDATRTAGKLLAVQMQRIAEEEEDRRRRDRDGDILAREAALQHEEAPDPNNIVYADEIGMSQKERLQSRKFHKKDAYHLPEIEGGIAAMGKPDDPRIMSVEELEDYAKQFHNGEDVNLYDFSKIDFDGDFFKSLPPPDRYNILNAARLRSRLRMGLSKDQLDDMFPDRMAFSRFQIERVKERNHLTQRLMYEVGMTGIDLTIVGSSRVAGEKDREYILVKNDGVEGGWALGVVSKEKDVGEEHKPIDVDAIQVQYQTKEEEEEDDDDFEDIPIEGLNRLPKPPSQVSMPTRTARPTAGRQRQAYNGRDVAAAEPEKPEDSLFVSESATDTMKTAADEELIQDEEDDLSKAIAMSLQNQHGIGLENEIEDENPEETSAPAPEWNQKAVEGPKPITSDRGSMIAHIVNNRSNAAVPKRQEGSAPITKPLEPAKDDDSDSEEDMQAILAKSRKMKRTQPAPVVENKKNPFDGPLPFPKLNWGSAIFSQKQGNDKENAEQPPGFDEDADDDAGGFEKQDEDGPKPLPPWLIDDTDIRESMRKQQDVEREINAEDRMEAEEEERLRRREMRDKMIEIEDDSGSESDVMIVDKPASPKAPEAEPPITKEQAGHVQEESFVVIPAQMTEEDAAGHESTKRPDSSRPSSAEASDKASSPEPELIEGTPAAQSLQLDTLADAPISNGKEASASPEPEFEDVTGPSTQEDQKGQERNTSESPEPDFEDVVAAETDNAEAAEPNPAVQIALTSDAAPLVGVEPKAKALESEHDGLFDDVEDDEFSDPEDEELMAQMAEEAEEHARFASELNQKPARQNREDYEKELRQLRNQQKKDRRDADEVSQVMVSECQALLRLFGIPYVTAPMEAEAQCSELVKLGLVDGIVTDDSDTFLFGGTRVYKNMFSSNKFVECYLGNDLEKELSLSREQLISLAQLLGSDYTEGLQGVGPVTAVEILSEFPGKKGLEHFRDWWAAVQGQTRPMEADADSTFRRKFRKSQATKLFLPPTFPSSAVYDAYLHPEVDDSAEPFQWGVPDVEGLRQFLMATIGWSKERTDEVLVPVIRDMNKRAAEGTQSNITRFYGGGVGVGAKEAFAPKEKGQGSKRMAAAVDRLKANIRGGPVMTAPAPSAPAKRKRGGRKPTGAQGNEVDGNDADDGESEETNGTTTATTRAKGKRTKAS